MDDIQHQTPEREHGRLNRAWWVFIAFAAIAAYFLIAEHRAHLSGLLYYWPFLLVLACPLMHLFMHGGHGNHGGGHKRNATAKGDKQ